MRAHLRERLAQHRPGYPYTIGRTLAIYSGLMTAILLAALDQTILATALPSIANDLGGFSNYSWVFSAYLLCQTVTVPVYGRLGDIYGRRKLFFISIPIFLAGSALCGLSHSMTQLIVFRGIQGIGAGGVIPLAMATTAEVVPARDRGRYAALISTGFVTAAIAGPAVGGLIVDNTSWRWIFYVNLPVGGLALLVITLALPRTASSHVKQRVDVIGASLLVVATTSLLLALLWGGGSYPWTSVEVIGAFATAAVVGVAFVRRMSRTASPILPVQVVRERTVATGAIATGLSVMCIFGATAFVPLFAQGVLGTSATSSGVVVMPQTLGAVAATILVGQWIARTGRYRGNALLGPVLLGLGMLLLASMGTGTTQVEVAVFMVILGVGSGLMMQTFTIAAQSSVPPQSLGSATSMIQFSRAIGTTIGVTLFGVIVNHGLPAGLRGHRTVLHRLPSVQRHQLAGALHPAFLLGALLCAIVFVVVWLGLEQRPLRDAIDEPTPVVPEEPSERTGIRTTTESLS